MCFTGGLHQELRAYVLELRSLVALSKSMFLNHRRVSWSLSYSRGVTLLSSFVDVIQWILRINKLTLQSSLILVVAARNLICLYAWGALPTFRSFVLPLFPKLLEPRWLMTIFIRDLVKELTRLFSSRNLFIVHIQHRKLFVFLLDIPLQSLFLCQLLFLNILLQVHHSLVMLHLNLIKLLVLLKHRVVFPS